MPETPMPNDSDTYTSAVRDLADALAEVWQACEAGYDHRRGLGTVGNLPEALSYALGLAAVTLGLDRDATGALVDDQDAQPGGGRGPGLAPARLLGSRPRPGPDLPARAHRAPRAALSGRQSGAFPSAACRPSLSGCCAPPVRDSW